MGADGGIQDALVVNEEEACESLCFNFHTKKKILLSKVGKNHVTIAKIIKEIRHGSKTKKQFSELNIDAVHITDLIDKDLVLKQRQYHTSHAFNFAKERDILIPRVGKRSIIRESLVASGEGYYTDSIFKLPPPQKMKPKSYGVQYQVILERNGGVFIHKGNVPNI